MRRTAMLATSTVALIALSGCGSSGGPAAYLDTSNTEVAFIRWQETSSGHLQGNIIEDQVSGTSPTETISVSSSSFTGSINGGSVSLKFNGFLGIQANIIGALNGNKLALQIPQTGGTIQQATFTTASISMFNKAVHALHSRIRTANSAEAEAQNAMKTRGRKAAEQQAAVNSAADGVAHAACNQYGGSWSSPGTADYNADGYTFSIPDGPKGASCDNVPYLGSDGATYYVTIYFSSTGASQSAGSGTGTATEAECSRGYYPDGSAGPASAQPGNWSGVLGICLTKG